MKNSGKIVLFVFSLVMGSFNPQRVHSQGSEFSFEKQPKTAEEIRLMLQNEIFERAFRATVLIESSERAIDANLVAEMPRAFARAYLSAHLVGGALGAGVAAGSSIAIHRYLNRSIRLELAKSGPRIVGPKWYTRAGGMLTTLGLGYVVYTAYCDFSVRGRRIVEQIPDFEHSVEALIVFVEKYFPLNPKVRSRLKELIEKQTIAEALAKIKGGSQGTEDDKIFPLRELIIKSGAASAERLNAVDKALIRIAYESRREEANNGTEREATDFSDLKLDLLVQLRNWSIDMQKEYDRMWAQSLGDGPDESPALESGDPTKISQSKEFKLISETLNQLGKLIDEYEEFGFHLAGSHR